MSPSQTPRQARLCLSMGINCLRSMARALRIPYDDDPLPTTPIRLSRQEFDEGFRRLESVHFPAERSADDAWRNFQGWRINYEPIVDTLTRSSCRRRLLVHCPARAGHGPGSPWCSTAPPRSLKALRGSASTRPSRPRRPEIEQLIGLGGPIQVHPMGERLAQARQPARLHEGHQEGPCPPGWARTRHAG